MPDEQIVKRIMESKSEQKLRNSLNSGKDFEVSNNTDKIVLQNYEQMDETAKQQFTQKGWKNG